MDRFFNSTSNNNSAKVYSTTSVSKSDYYSEKDEKENENSDGTKYSIYKRVKNYLSSAAANKFAEYGPPYDYDEYYAGALLHECSQQNAKSLEIHRLLNAKVDPNDIDTDELNFRPIHWCAKFCHFVPLKMLIRAKAKLDVTNEFGQTPLSVCVMMKQTLNKITTQKLIVEYLLEIGKHTSMYMYISVFMMNIYISLMICIGVIPYL